MSLTDLLIGVGREFNIPSDEVSEKYLIILQKLRYDNPTKDYNWYESEAQRRLVNFYKATRTKVK